MTVLSCVWVCGDGILTLLLCKAKMFFLVLSASVLGLRVLRECIVTMDGSKNILCLLETTNVLN